MCANCSVNTCRKWDSIVKNECEQIYRLCVQTRARKNSSIRSAESTIHGASTLTCSYNINMLFLWWSNARPCTHTNGLVEAHERTNMSEGTKEMVDARKYKFIFIFRFMCVISPFGVVAKCMLNEIDTKENQSETCCERNEPTNSNEQENKWTILKRMNGTTNATNPNKNIFIHWTRCERERTQLERDTHRQMKIERVKIFETDIVEILYARNRIRLVFVVRSLLLFCSRVTSPFPLPVLSLRSYAKQ